MWLRCNSGNDIRGVAGDFLGSVNQDKGITDEVTRSSGASSPGVNTILNHERVKLETGSYRAYDTPQ